MCPSETPASFGGASWPNNGNSPSKAAAVAAARQSHRMGDILSWDVSMTKLIRIFLLSFLALAIGRIPAAAQSKGNAKAGAESGTLVERGRYIVESVAM